MAMAADIVVGGRVPEVKLGYLKDGEVHGILARDVFQHHRAVVIGVPGAFIPVCTKQHIPDFVRSARRLRASGFTELVCIAPNDPFTLHAWALAVDPRKRLRFLSDGNLDFTGALGLTSTNRALFLGWRSERYMMIIENGIITRLRVEPDILTYSDTRPAQTWEVEIA
jgi:2-Cys peroxiredoxin 5